MFACMHAWASLSWKPVAPEGKNAVTINKKLNICASMHACWGIPQLEASCPEGETPKK